MRFSFALNRLELNLLPAAALDALRDYFERVAREYDRRNGGEDANSVDGSSAVAGASSGSTASGDSQPRHRQPIESQIEVLNLWHQTMRAMLRSFTSKFKCASCTVLAAADKDLFQASRQQGALFWSYFPFGHVHAF